MLNDDSNEGARDAHRPGDLWPLIFAYLEMAWENEERDQQTGGQTDQEDLRSKHDEIIAIGRMSDHLVQLGELKASVEIDMEVLQSREYLLACVENWRQLDDVDPHEQYGLLSHFLLEPTETWVDKAWEAILSLKKRIDFEIQELMDAESNKTGIASDAPPGTYSPFARVLYPFRQEFITPLHQVEDVFRNRSGLISMASSVKSVGALVLEEIRIGLGIEKTAQLKRVRIAFPKAKDTNVADVARPWFEVNNRMANLVNVANKRDPKNLEFSNMLIRTSNLRAELKALRDNNRW